MNKDELERRVEAAAIERTCGGSISPRLAWAGWPAHLREQALDDARQTLKAAFPELFSSPPTAWLAPMEATEAMMEAWMADGNLANDADDDWNTMRDAYLSPKDTKQP